MSRAHGCLGRRCRLSRACATSCPGAYFGAVPMRRGCLVAMSILNPLANWLHDLLCMGEHFPLALQPCLCALHVRESRAFQGGTEPRCERRGGVAYARGHRWRCMLPLLDPCRSLGYVQHSYRRPVLPLLKTLLLCMRSTSRHVLLSVPLWRLVCTAAAPAFVGFAHVTRSLFFLAMMFVTCMMHGTAIKHKNVITVRCLSSTALCCMLIFLAHPWWAHGPTCHIVEFVWPSTCWPHNHISLP